MAKLSIRIPVTIVLASLILALPSASFYAGDDAPKKEPKLTPEEAQKLAASRLRHVAIAFHHYYENYGEFPPAALVSKEGQSLLSWRVLLLPHVGQGKLFREFKLTEPWDSPHNKKLLDKMPDVYRPVPTEGVAANETLWQVFTGKGTVFENDKGCRLQEITDGTSNTILVVEAARPIPWTKPEDLPYDDKKPLPKLGRMFPDVFLFAMADGAAYTGRRDAPEKNLRAAIDRDDGFALPFQGLLAAKQLDR